MRRSIRLIALATVLMATASHGPLVPVTAAASGPTKPNFVIVLTDDQRWDTIGRCLPSIDPDDDQAGSNSCMPFLQQDLMPDGVTFERGYVTTALCCPSRASILTGQYQRHHGVWDNNGFAQFNDDSTLATWLHDDGYRTGLFGKYLNGYGAAGQPLYVPPGWDSWHAYFGGAGYKTYPLIEKEGSGSAVLNNYNDFNTTDNGACRPGNFYSTDFLCRKAVDFLSSNTTDPFLLYFAPFSPHGPAQIARRYKNYYTSLEQPKYPNYNKVPSPHTPSWIQDEPIPSTTLNQIKVGFRIALATNRAADDSIHALYEQVASEGQLANTVWVFLSDNGFANAEHRYNSKACEYEECHKVPFVVACPPTVCPGGTPGLVDSTHSVLNIDIAPTFAGLAGVTPTIPVDGQSLVPLLENPAAPWRSSFLISDDALLPGKLSGIVEDLPDGHTYKYVWLGSTTEYELYDLTTDPWELTNLIDDGVHTAVQTQLASELANALAPPVITLTGPGTATNQSDVSFSWTSAKPATFTCSVDGAAFQSCGSGATGNASANGLSEGPHTFGVHALDADNNQADASYSFTVDLTPPPPAVFTQTPPDPSGASVAFAFSDADPEAGFICSLDGGAPTTCGSPHGFSGLTDGVHKVSVTAVDAAGNSAASATSFSWTVVVPIDSTPPSVVLKTPQPQTILTGRKVASSWSGTDDMAVTNFVLEERIGLGGTFAQAYGGTKQAFSRTGDLGATYCYRVTAYDAASNSATSPEACTAVPFDDTAASIGYLGTVDHQAATGAFENTLTILNEAGDEADISFTGNRVGVVAEKGPSSGKFQIWIDGAVVKTVDLYAGSTKLKVVVFKQSLTQGLHEVRLVWIPQKNSLSIGNRIGLDGIAVFS